MKNEELDWNFHLLYLIFHLRTHFHGGGVGIRQFMDVAVVTKYNDKLDWDWIEQKSKELDIWTFSQKVFGLNSRWFGIEPPITVKPVDDAFYYEATTELCAGGVFGSNENNGRKIAVYGNRHPLLSIANRIRGMIFVPYKDMIRMPQYDFLVGRHYLLPVAWIYRAWLTIEKMGINNTKQRINSTIASKKDINKQRQYVEKWNK